MNWSVNCRLWSVDFDFKCELFLTYSLAKKGFSQEQDQMAWLWCIKSYSLLILQIEVLYFILFQHLASKDAGILCILGSGLQAQSHAQALKLVRDFTEVHKKADCYVQEILCGYIAEYIP